jgi:glycosyltransferase involved in cell wall biosynthesis
MQVKVILLTEIISPYRIPVFNEITQRLGERFQVIFFGETEKRRQWKICKEDIKFSYEVLPFILFQKKDSAPHFFNPALLHKLIKYSADIIIIGGYHHPSSLLAILYAKLYRRKIIFWSETNLYNCRRRYFIREIYKRWFIRNCTGYIVPGRAAFAYLVSQGAEAKKIWIAPNAVDNDYFSQAASKYLEKRREFRHSRSYPEKLILYVGRLIEEKGVSDLLKAFRIFSQGRSDAGLMLIGDGKEKNRYAEFCKINNIKNVFFEGFIQQDALPAYYAACDVFVFPSKYDPWGLVLNEAMACKLPVISSDGAGAAYDLISNGQNGFVFKRGDSGQLADYFKDILDDEQKRINMGQKSFEIIQNYSPEKCAQGFIRAIREI